MFLNFTIYLRKLAIQGALFLTLLVSLSSSFPPCLKAAVVDPTIEEVIAKIEQEEDEYDSDDNLDIAIDSASDDEAVVESEKADTLDGAWLRATTKASGLKTAQEQVLAKMITDTQTAKEKWEQIIFLQKKWNEMSGKSGSGHDTFIDAYKAAGGTLLDALKGGAKLNFVDSLGQDDDLVKGGFTAMITDKDWKNLYKYSHLGYHLNKKKKLGHGEDQRLEPDAEKLGTKIKQTGIKLEVDAMIKALKFDAKSDKKLKDGKRLWFRALCTKKSEQSKFTKELALKLIEKKEWKALSDFSLLIGDKNSRYFIKNVEEFRKAYAKALWELMQEGDVDTIYQITCREGINMTVFNEKDTYREEITELTADKSDNFLYTIYGKQLQHKHTLEPAKRKKVNEWYEYWLKYEMNDRLYNRDKRKKNKHKYWKQAETRIDTKVTELTAQYPMPAATAGGDAGGDTTDGSGGGAGSTTSKPPKSNDTGKYVVIVLAGATLIYLGWELVFKGDQQPSTRKNKSTSSSRSGSADTRRQRRKSVKKK